MRDRGRAGRAVAFATAPGQAHEPPLAPAPLDRPPRVPLRAVGGRGHSFGAFRERVRWSGARPAVPARANEAAVACPAWVHDNRDRAERLRARLEEWRAVATRYERAAASFLGVLCLAATAGWLKPYQALVTIDAIGAQNAMAATILGRGGGGVPSIKVGRRGERFGVGATEPAAGVFGGDGLERRAEGGVQDPRASGRGRSAGGP